MNILQFVFFIGVLDAESFCKAIAEVVGCTGLQSLTIVHQGFDRECMSCTSESFFFCFFAFYYGDRQHFMAEIGVYVQHLDRSFLCFFCCCMSCVAFLPQEFHGSQERTCCFFPTNNGAPLIVQFRQVSVGLDDVCVVFAEQCFGSGAYTHTFFQFFVTTVSNPGYFWSKTFYVVFFFLQQAFRDEHGHVAVFYICCFETSIQIFLDQFPDRIAVRTDYHAAFDAGVFYQFSFFYNVSIPLGKIQLHVSDGFYKFLIFCHFRFLLWNDIFTGLWAKKKPSSP